MTRAVSTAHGRQARERAPLAGHAAVPSYDGRGDVVALLEGQAASRVPELVPIRYGRMLSSPFAFFRGAALPMADDLSRVPRSGLEVQLCGDAHLANFGVFGSPERHLVFDINDFDETSPGPFEWDVKRLAASLEVAARGNGFKSKARRNVVLATVRAYREAMRDFAARSTLEVWYAHLDPEQALAEKGDRLLPEQRRRTAATLAKARTRDSLQALAKLTTIVDGRPVFRADPPLVVPIQDLLSGVDASALDEELRGILHDYRSSLPAHRRLLLDRFTLVQVARKVVGVGSVGTRAWILLLEGVDGADPLLLQAKEAQASVLAAYTGGRVSAHHGERVVAGQQLMQAHSDIFLGWQRTTGVDGVPRDYYLRQLRDWKRSADVETMIPSGMTVYGRLCGWTLARAHARSGDRIALAAYLGGKDTFDHAVADFAASYADLTERDHAALATAAEVGRIVATEGV